MAPRSTTRHDGTSDPASSAPPDHTAHSPRRPRTVRDRPADDGPQPRPSPRRAAGAPKGRHRRDRGGGAVVARVRADGTTVDDAFFSFCDPATGAPRRSGKRGFPTSAAAGKYLRAQTTLIDAGNYVPPTRLTLADYLEQGLDAPPRLLAQPPVRPPRRHRPAVAQQRPARPQHAVRSAARRGRRRPAGVLPHGPGQAPDAAAGQGATRPRSPPGPPTSCRRSSSTGRTTATCRCGTCWPPPGCAGARRSACGGRTSTSTAAPPPSGRPSGSSAPAAGPGRRPSSPPSRTAART